MKKLPHFILALALMGCGKPAARDDHETEASAHFKPGYGVSLSEAMKKTLGLKLADVEEHGISPSVSLTMYVTDGNKGSDATQLTGWLPEESAGLLSPGVTADIILGDGRKVAGVVRHLGEASAATWGEIEATLSTPEPLPLGSRARVIIKAATRRNIVAVPREAVLKAAEGEFVYTVNENYFVRTPIKTGARNDRYVEVVDGLYAGDQIVSARATPLWMTELQARRAGHACSEGH